MDEPGFDDYLEDDILDDEQNDTQWYLNNMPQFQDAQLEQDPRGLILKQDNVPCNFLQRKSITLDDENEEGYLTQDSRSSWRKNITTRDSSHHSLHATN